MSSYKIVDISGAAPEEGKMYFVDANVWVILLDPPTTPDTYESTYIAFLEAIINLAGNNKCKNPPKLILNSLVISEFTNAHIKRLHEQYNEFQKSPVDIKSFRQTDEYDLAVTVLRDNFSAYAPYCQMIENKVDPIYVFNTFPALTDFNDYYYYEMATEEGFAIITNDKDFLLPSVEIITGRKNLLKHA